MRRGDALLLSAVVSSMAVSFGAETTAEGGGLWLPWWVPAPVAWVLDGSAFDSLPGMPLVGTGGLGLGHGGVTASPADAAPSSIGGGKGAQMTPLVGAGAAAGAGAGAR
jgi:hypothetical protein